MTLSILYPTSYVEYTAQWFNPGNISADDGSYVTSRTDATGTTANGKWSGFGFNIPSGSTINSITVRLKRKVSSSSSTCYLYRKYYKGATEYDASTLTDRPTTDNISTFSIDNSLFSAEDLNNNLLSVSFQAYTTNLGQYYMLDYLRVEVDYSEHAQISYPSANVASQSTGFVNPSNAYANDNSYATASGTTTLGTTYSGFAFSIPSGATINRILLQVERKIQNTALNYTFVITVKNGATTIFTDTSTAEPTTDTLYTFYISASITAEDLNNDNITVELAASASIAGYSHSVDYVKITADYTQPLTNGSFAQII